MVKWLTKIEVSEHESNHWHHYHGPLHRHSLRFHIFSDGPSTT